MKTDVEVASDVSSEESDSAKPGKLKAILFWFMVFSSIYALVTMIIAIMAYVELSELWSIDFVDTDIVCWRFKNDKSKNR